MNKYEDALDWLIWHCIAKNEYHEDDVVYERIKNSFIEPVIKPLRELIEKATPKKPTEADISEKNSYCCWMCPTCGRVHINDSPLNYCSDCGQAIDWRDYEKYLREGNQDDH